MNYNNIEAMEFTKEWIDVVEKVKKCAKKRNINLSKMEIVEKVKLDEGK